MDRADDAVTLLAQSDADRRDSARMADRVVHRFLRDSIERELHPRGCALAQLTKDRDLDRRAAGDALREELQRLRETEVVENRRTELVRQVAQALAGLVQQLADLLESLRRGVRRILDSQVELDPRGGDDSARFVVQGQRDFLGSVLERLVQ